MVTKSSPIVVEQTYKVAVPVVWRAITDAEQMPKWFFESIESFKPEVGFETQFNVHAGGKDYLHVWKVTEVVPNKRIAYTFNFGGYEGEGLVVWELSEVADGTKLTLTHTGIEAFAQFAQDDPAFKRESGEAGWKYFLKESLKGYLEPES